MKVVSGSIFSTCLEKSKWSYTIYGYDLQVSKKINSYLVSVMNFSLQKVKKPKKRIKMKNIENLQN